MSAKFSRLLAAFESHSLSAIGSALDVGIDIHAMVDGKQPIDYLIEMYFRSDAFPDCLRLLLERGARIEDQLLRATLLNDVAELEGISDFHNGVISHRVSLTCAFTPLKQSS
jgi:hypothetical protein